MIDLGCGGLFIDVSNTGYTLCQKRAVKDKTTGEMKDAPINLSYHGSLECAVAEAWRTLQRRRLSDGDYTLSEAIEVMQSVKREMMDKIKTIQEVER